MSDKPKVADRTQNRSVVLSQYDNPRYVSNEALDEVQEQNRRRLEAREQGKLSVAALIPVDREQYVYRVETLRNLLEPAVGEVIRKERVQQLIEDGVDVNIKPVK